MLDKRGETKEKETQQVLNYDGTNDEDAVRMNLDSMEVNTTFIFFFYNPLNWAYLTQIVLMKSRLSVEWEEW